MTRWIPHSIAAWTIAYSIVFGLLLAAAAITSTYRTSRQFIEESALQTVGITATARKTDLVRTLTRQRERVENVLRLADQSCAGQSDETCARKIALDFAHAERAVWSELVVQGHTVFVGPRPRRMPSNPREEQLALFFRDERNEPHYVIARVESGRRMIVAFPIQNIRGVFADRSGLGNAGETFLADPSGRFVTSPRYPVATSESHPIDAVPMTTCLAGSSGEMIAADYRGVEVIHGFRYVPEIGGGCVMAHLERSAALAPAYELRREVMTASLLVLLPGLFIGIVAAKRLTRPLQRLTRTAEEVSAGNYDAPVDVRGPREIRVLGSTLASLVTSVRESLARERELRLEAEQANRAKDQFLATLSHELRTPMTAVIGWARMLELQHDDPETVRTGIDAIKRSSQAQAELIDDLLDASRIATGKLRLESAPVDMRQLIAELTANFRPAAAAKKIRLEVSLPETHVVISGDKARLAQIMNNLLTNALKFTDESGRIDVTLECAHKQATITVSDTGVGIAPEFLTAIFDPFQQQDSSATRRHGGLGLGLAIVKQLVDMHHGTITAESEGVGHGATMRIVFPMAASTPAAVEDRDESALPSLAGKRLLVIDDEVEIAELVAAIFQSAGAEVTTTTSAREASEQLTSRSFDLLVCDLAMPDEDGLSFISRVRTNGLKTPAVVLTARGGLDDEQRALAAGFDAFVRKPADPVHLARVAAGLLGDVKS